MISRFKQNKHFTLVEMLIVVFIIAALVAVLGPAQQYIFKDTEKTSIQADAKGIGTAALQHLTEKDTLPVTNETVTVLDKNTEYIIKEQLVDKGVSKTMFNILKDNGAFKKLDEQAIAKYIKGDKSNLDQYFIVDKTDGLAGYNNEIMGYVFTMGAHETHDGKWYSGMFDAEIQPGGPTVCPEPWKSQGYTCIGNAEEFYEIRNNLSGKYVLVEDIDLAEYPNWTPIGTNIVAFAGTLDGNGHIISNLTITNSTGTHVGLFGWTNTHSTLKNLKLDNVNITSQHNRTGALLGGGFGIIDNAHVLSGTVKSTSDTLGGLVGMQYGTLSNSSSAAIVESSSYYVGGLVGNSYGRLENSYATGSVTGSTSVGGLMGHAENADKINSYATGDVTSTGGEGLAGGFAGNLSGGVNFVIDKSYATGNVTALNGGDNVGGFIGMNRNSSSIMPTIKRSYATGNVVGDNYTAGFIGNMYHVNIENSYATGNVSGSGYVSGFVAAISSSGAHTIKNNYFTGSILSGGYSGYAFVGSISNTANTTLTDNFYNSETNGNLKNDKTGVTPATTSQMKLQGTYVGWDFTNIWSIDETISYPSLR